ncbi:DsrH/TusB family sulfur metabolism protein, partial [Escherichia coli]
SHNMRTPNFRAMPKRCQEIYNEDLIARGLTGQISNDIIPIDYTDFVRLTVKHSSQMAW